MAIYHLEAKIVSQGFTAAEYKAAQSDGWEKQYQYWAGKK